MSHPQGFRDLRRAPGRERATVASTRSERTRSPVFDPRSRSGESRSLRAGRALAVVLLAAAVAFGALGGAAWARGGSTPPQPVIDGPEVDLVRAFYAAANDALRTGETSRVERLLAEDVVEHLRRPESVPGRDGVVATLRAMRVTFPDLQLVPEDIRAAGDLVTVRVRLRGTDGSFLGAPLGAQQVSWGPIDQFRVARGKIVEHWGVPADAAQFRPLTEGAIRVPGTSWRRPALERRTYASVASWSGETAAGPVLILGESGSLAVTVEEAAVDPAVLIHAGAWERGSTGESIGKGVMATLVPGDLLVLPEGSRFSTRPADSAPAAVLVLTLEEPRIPGGAPVAPPGPPEGIDRMVLATGQAGALPPEAIVRFGRAALGPGAGVPSHAIAGLNLMVVESGSLAVAVGGANAWVYDGATGTVSGSVLPELRAGDGALIPAGATVAYGNEGSAPSTVLLVVLEAGME